MKKIFQITKKEKRLDQYLAEVLSYTRSQALNLIEQSLVEVDEKTVTKAGTPLKIGSSVVVELKEPELIDLKPEPHIKVNIIFEDEELIVINKPAGLVVHPGAGIKSGTLVNALLATHQGALFGDKLRPGIVHRLDKETSGLMVVAKTAETFYGLQKQFSPPRTIHRIYLAASRKKPGDQRSGVIDLPLGRDPRDRKKIWLRSDGTGKNAITRWELLNEGDVNIFRVELETGRTHQIRAHFAIKNAPLVGDRLYNKNWREDQKRFALDRQALHAWKLSFIHQGRVCSFESDIPEDLKSIFKAESLKDG